jgi:hypothetical protein
MAVTASSASDSSVREFPGSGDRPGTENGRSVNRDRALMFPIVTDVGMLDTDDALNLCAWCGIEIDEGKGRFVPYKLAEREQFSHREGSPGPPDPSEAIQVGGLEEEPAVRREIVAFAKDELTVFERALLVQRSVARVEHGARYELV